MMEGTGAELRRVLGGLGRSPGFTTVAVLSLALGIGANTAMFGVVRTLLLTPLPVQDPDELAVLAWRHDGEFSISQIGSASYTDLASGADYRSNFTYPIYRALLDARPPGTDLFAFAFLRGVSVAVADQPALLAGGALADGRYFSTLGVPMALGRPLGEADDRPDAPLVVVLSHALWMRAFGGDPEVMGRTVRVNGVPAEVVGVTAKGFEGLSLGGFFPQTEITIPLSAQPVVYDRMASGRSLFAADDVFWLRVMARVRSGTSRAAAREALASAMRAQPSPLPADGEHTLDVRLLPGTQGAQPVRPEIRRLLYVLLGVVAAVLLIACVNLAGLTLARGVSRRHELAVRRALGAGWTRLVRRSVLEGLVLAGLGTAAALALVLGTRRFFGVLLTGSLGSGAFGDLDMTMEIDPWIVAASAGLGVASMLLFGLLPALHLSSVDPGAWLKQRAAGEAAPKLTAGRLLIALQIAVSVPLVVGAGLFLRTVANLGAVELGFDPRGLVTFQLDPGYTRLPPEEYAALYQRVLTAVGEVPGVRRVSLMENALMSGIVSNGPVTVDGQRHSLYRNAVGPGFLETLGVRLIEGRMPGVQDVRGAPNVAAVNETAVRELFAGRSPVGRVLELFNRQTRIVGVVSDTPYRDRRAPVPPTLYDSALQRDGYGRHHVVLRTDVAPPVLEPAVREAVARVNPDLPVPRMLEQTELIARTGARERVFTQLLSIFGGFALLLAGIGLHGVTAYSVSRRTKEIGVRVAIGARPGQILGLVLRQVVVLATAGLVLGVPAALAAGPLLGSLLYGVAPTDPVAIGGAAAVMLAVAAASGLLPALRAAGVDAQVALRAE